MVQCLLRHGAGWCEDGVGDLLCSAVGMESSYIKCAGFSNGLTSVSANGRASVS